MVEPCYFFMLKVTPSSKIAVNSQHSNTATWWFPTGYLETVAGGEARNAFVPHIPPLTLRLREMFTQPRGNELYLDPLHADPHPEESVLGGPS